MKEEKRRGFFEAVFLGKNQIWRYLLVLLLVVIGYLVGQIPLGIAIAIKSMSGEIDQGLFEEFQRTADVSLFGLDTNAGLFLLLLSFVGGLVFLCAGVHYIHRRSWRTLVSYSGKINFSKIAYGFSLWLFLAFVAELPFLISEPDSYVFRFDAGRFFVLLLLAVLLLPLQTTMEEFFFRGWIMQGMGAAFGSKIFPLVISSALFAGVHMSNPEVLNYGAGPMMTYYLTAGLFLGLITILDDSLDLAIGVHFATNFYAAVFVNYESAALQTGSLFKYTGDLNVAAMNVAFVILALVFIFLASKKYNWDFSIVSQPVIEPEVVHQANENSRDGIDIDK